MAAAVADAIAEAKVSDLDIKEAVRVVVERAYEERMERSRVRASKAEDRTAAYHFAVERGVQLTRGQGGAQRGGMQRGAQHSERKRGRDKDDLSAYEVQRQNTMATNESVLRELLRL
eukprot:7245409-Prymnesium_polylepis.2